MNESANNSNERKKAPRNPFLHDVSYMFNIEAQSVLEAKVDELKELCKSMECSARLLNTTRMCIISASKPNVGILISPRLMSIRVDAIEYVNSDVEADFIVPFVTKYYEILGVETIDTIVIAKNYTFALQRANELAKETSIEQYCQSLFSSKFIAEHSGKGVFKTYRKVNVSAKYTSFVSKDSLRVELQVGSVDFGSCDANTLGGRLENDNEAICDMWRYAMSEVMQDVLSTDKEGKAQ